MILLKLPCIKLNFMYLIRTVFFTVHHCQKWERSSPFSQNSRIDLFSVWIYIWIVSHFHVIIQFINLFRVHDVFISFFMDDACYFIFSVNQNWLFSNFVRINIIIISPPFHFSLISLWVLYCFHSWISLQIR